ncbi:Uncharacterized protein Fot_43312 [Forsythia ovata]|uniref:Uncharacterized protein n=1 Tax=Forsythia ovata TaxID=205694 RepID=A0ABD1RNP7_9LAMI
MEMEPRTSLAEEGKGKRTRTKAVVDKVETMRFQLFKTLIKGKEGYILQMQKAEPVTEETSPNVQTKCKLSLQERLVGWTFEARKRKSSNITDKNKILIELYIAVFIHSHGKAKKTFRSVKELGNFILFCSSVEVSSHRHKAKMTEEEKKEAFLAEANQNRQNMDEMVVPLGDEDNAAQGDEDGILSEVLEHPITNFHATCLKFRVYTSSQAGKTQQKESPTKKEKRQKINEVWHSFISVILECNQVNENVAFMMYRDLLNIAQLVERRDCSNLNFADSCRVRVRFLPLVWKMLLASAVKKQALNSTPTEDILRFTSSTNAPGTWVVGVLKSSDYNKKQEDKNLVLGTSK